MNQPATTTASEPKAVSTPTIPGGTQPPAPVAPVAEPVKAPEPAPEPTAKHPDPAPAPAPAAAPAKGGTVTSDPAGGTVTSDPAAKTEPVKQPDPAALPQDIKLELPEGSLLSTEALERTAAHARERGLTQEQATELVGRESQAVDDHMTAQRTVYDQTVNGWVDACKADADFGGEKFLQSSEAARRFINAYGDEDLKKELEATGFGNHPRFFRMCARAGAKILADQPVPGQPPAKTEKQESIAERLYGKTGKPEPKHAQPK